MGKVLEKRDYVPQQHLARTVFLPPLRGGVQRFSGWSVVLHTGPKTATLSRETTPLPWRALP